MLRLETLNLPLMDDNTIYRFSFLFKNKKTEGIFDKKEENFQKCLNDYGTKQIREKN